MFYIFLHVIRTARNSCTFDFSVNIHISLSLSFSLSLCETRTAARQFQKISPVKYAEAVCRSRRKNGLTPCSHTIKLSRSRWKFVRCETASMHELLRTKSLACNIMQHHASYYISRVSSPFRCVNKKNGRKRNINLLKWWLSKYFFH